MFGIGWIMVGVLLVALVTKMLDISGKLEMSGLLTLASSVIILAFIIGRLLGIVGGVKATFGL